MAIFSRALSALLVVAAFATTTRANTIVVTQSGFGFTPQNITIQLGDTVQWQWTAFNHDVSEGIDGLINGNELFTFPLTSVNPTPQFTFDAAFVAAHPMPGGLYNYFCSIHFAGGMKGTITVISEPGTAMCFGDGSGTACPCANNSAVGANVGCLSSLGTGGKLAASGSASISNDTLVLQGSGMPNSSALYFQGTSAQSAGAGGVFGDGLRCAAGSVLRLGTKNNVGGGSTYPALGDISVSVKGANAVGGSRVYQVWYRNAAAFCTASTFNLTNGYSLTWGA